MLLHYLWLFLLASLGKAADIWEFNQNPEFCPIDPQTQRPIPQQDPGPATFFLDPTCTSNGNDLATVMDEVIQMAREGFDRLGNNLPEFNAGYTRIFKVAPNDDEVLRDQMVRRVFHRIKGLQRVDNFEAAHIRIHCDDDVSTDTIVEGGGAVDNNNLPRWIPAPDEWWPDVGPLGNGVPNSGLIFEAQVFYDRINLMYRTPGDEGVQEEEPDDASNPGEKLTMAQTYLARTGLPTNQNPFRETITVSNFALAKGATLRQQLGSDIVKTEMKDHNILQSVTLFHELCHCRNIFGPIDQGKDEVYEWPNIEAADAATVRRQGDAYAFLGLYALMNSRNIQLKNPPSSDLIPLNPFQEVIKVRRSLLFDRRDTKNHDTSPSTYAALRRKAVAFTS